MVMENSSDNSIFTLFQDMCEQRKMKPEEAQKLVSDTMRAALERKYGRGVLFEMNLDQKAKTFEVKRIRTVVESVEDPITQISLKEAQEIDEQFEVGEELEEPIDPQTLGRYASYAGRDAIRRDTRAHVKGGLMDRWAAKLGTLIWVNVQSIENGTAFCTVPEEAGLEVILPSRHQDRSKPLTEGASVEGAIIEVKEEKHGVRLVITESGPEVMLAELRSRIAPDVWNKIDIVKAVREPGRATKIVAQPQPECGDFDAISALAGVRGALIRRLAEERGERIDLISPTDDVYEMVRMALTPAEIEDVEEEEGSGDLIAIVADMRSRREAIGEKGVNVRLAGKLVGRQIRIESLDGNGNGRGN